MHTSSSTGCKLPSVIFSVLCLLQVVYGCGNDRFGGCGSILHIHETGCGACGAGCACCQQSQGATTGARRQQAQQEAQQQPGWAEAPQGEQGLGGCQGTGSQQQQQQQQAGEVGGTQQSGQPASQQQPVNQQQQQQGPPGELQQSGRQQAGPVYGACYPCRRGLYAEEAVKLLQDFYIQGNPAGGLGWAVPELFLVSRKQSWAEMGWAGLGWAGLLSVHAV